MDLRDYLTDAGTSLGWAVDAQLRALVDGDSCDEQNPNALRLIAPWLRRLAKRGVEDAAELADDIDAFLARPA